MMTMADSKGRLKLLIVEDDERTLEELLRILPRHTDFELRSAAAPSKAVEIAGREKMDLVLLDLKLPEMNGLELLPLLKEKNPDLLATIMTGFGEADTPLIAKELGAVDFIEKPIDLSYLLATLKFQEREAKTRKWLRNTADLLDKLFSLAQDGIVIADENDRVLISNPIGEKLFEFKANHKDGEKTFYEDKEYELNITKSGERELLHFKEVTKAVEKSKSESRAEMARLLSHELHNCLTPVKLWLQELNSLDEGDKDFQKLSKKAAEEGIKQIERLSRLTKRFKEFSSEKEIKLKKMNIYEEVKAVIDSLSMLINEKSMAVEVEIAKDLTAKASEMELYHIFYNLLMNSIEAQSGKGGAIKIKGVKKETVQISIIDEGGGLPEEVEKAPFTPYLTTKENGTGLGLLLSRELARKMGGDLKLINHKGKGVEALLELKQ